MHAMGSRAAATPYLASVALSSLRNNVDGRSCRIAHDVHELALRRSISKAGMRVIKYEI